MAPLGDCRGGARVGAADRGDRDVCLCDELGRDDLAGRLYAEVVRASSYGSSVSRGTGSKPSYLLCDVDRFDAFGAPPHLCSFLLLPEIKGRDGSSHHSSLCRAARGIERGAPADVCGGSVPDRGNAVDFDRDLLHDYGALHVSGAC